MLPGVLYHLHEAQVSSNLLFLFVSLNILVIVSGVLEGPNAFSHLLGLCLSLVRYFEEHCRPLKRWMA